MQPHLDIGPVTLQTFGIAFALAFVGCGMMAYKRLGELGKPQDWAYEALFAALVGGVVGARIDYVVENYEQVKGDLAGNIFSGSGLVFWGGLIGGAIAVMGWAYWRGFLTLALFDLAAPCIAFGYAAGRVGCQVSGDGDYGTAWHGPWAMAYPDGTVPITHTVHPTPIYETLTMGLVTWFLWRHRDSYRPGVLFALYLVFAGAERFWVEFIRRNPDEVLGLTTPQLYSVVFFLVGAVWLALLARSGGLRARPSG